MEEWSVEDSLPVIEPGYTNPFQPDFTPEVPKIVDIDFRKQRHYQSLLGEFI